MSAVAAPRPFARPTLPRLTAIELRKAYDTRAGAWLLGLTAVATVALALVRALTGAAADQGLRGIFGVALIPSSILLPVVGILLVSSEFSQRTALSTFALVPDRGRVVRAKMQAAFVLAAAAVLLALLVAVVVTPLGGAADRWDLGAAEAGQGVVQLVLSVLWGLAYGLVLGAPAPAIVANFVLPAVFSILGELVGALDRAWDWLDPNRPMLALGDLSADATDWAHLAVSGTLWIALPLVVGVVLLLRREVK